MGEVKQTGSLSSPAFGNPIATSIQVKREATDQGILTFSSVQNIFSSLFAIMQRSNYLTTGYHTGNISSGVMKTVLSTSTSFKMCLISEAIVHDILQPLLFKLLENGLASNLKVLFFI